MAAVQSLGAVGGVQAACAALGVSRSAFYRTRQPDHVPTPRLASPRALAGAERDAVLACLHEARFQDRAPAAVYATLLDEGHYHCSIRTMYRVLAQTGEVRERRDQCTHPPYQKPDLVATGPNQFWSWDITKLKGPAKWTYFYLYVLLDVFSRSGVGWLVAPRESAELATRVIDDTCTTQAIGPGQLTVHADRGSSMTSKPVAFLLADLGITKTHSRPHVSDDNPYSESQFRTLKSRPDFPDRFGSLQDSRSFCQTCFPWDHEEHRHSGIALLTPAMLHYGQAPAILAQRQEVLTAAYHAHPERFVRRAPQPLPVPTEVWINKPENKGQ